MLNKRLIRFLKGAKRYVALTVACQWFALAANILVMLSFDLFLNRLLKDGSNTELVFWVLGGILAAVLLKSLCWRPNSP